MNIRIFYVSTTGSSKSPESENALYCVCMLHLCYWRASCPSRHHLDSAPRHTACKVCDDVSQGDVKGRHCQHVDDRIPEGIRGQDPRRYEIRYWVQGVATHHLRYRHRHEERKPSNVEPYKTTQV